MLRVHAFHRMMNNVHDHLSRLDLNLLRLFDAIAEHRHVTAAAATLGLSQSAASHALRRLRDSLDDPLFVRGADGLVLTPRAETLATSVRSALAMLEHAIQETSTFDPATSRRSFRIAASDGFDIIVLPSLLPVLARAAPRMSIAVVRLASQSIASSLQTGEVDLYYGVLPNQPTFAGLLPDPGVRGLTTANVYAEDWICLLRREHPRIRRAPTLRQYAREGHVLYSPTGGGPGIVDRLLEHHQLSRHVALRVSSFHAAVDSVHATDLLWTGPRRIAAVLDPQRRLRHCRPPLDLPNYTTRLVWHERFRQDPGHRWLREQIATSLDHTAG